MKYIRRFQILLLCAALLLGYAAAGQWIQSAPAKARAELQDIQGDRAALDGFPLELTLEDDVHAQRISISDGAVSSHTKYKSPNTSTSDESSDTFLYSNPPLAVPASGAHTKLTDGFLPSITWNVTPPEGHILSTDAADLYFNLDGALHRTGVHLCLPSGLSLRSDQMNIHIGYYSEASESTLYLDKSASDPVIYDTVVGDITEYDSAMSIWLDILYAAVDDTLFFAPVSASNRSLLSGEISIYRVTSFGEGNGSTGAPDHIHTAGSAEKLLSFDVRDSTVRILCDINDTLFAVVQTGDRLKFYQFDAEGKLLGSYTGRQAIQPLNGDDDSDTAQIQLFENQDADGAQYATCMFQQYNDAVLTSSLITLQTNRALHPVYDAPGGDRDRLYLAAWRDGRLLTVGLSIRDMFYLNPQQSNFSYISIDYPCLEVRNTDDRLLYRGALWTDLADDYHGQTNFRAFQDCYLNGDPLTRRKDYACLF